jgi:hypothetical protein
MSRRLLCRLAFMLYCHRVGRLTTIYVPGPQNIMADIASCPSKALTFFPATTPVLSDHDFLLLFNVTFPLSDQQAWGLAQVLHWVKSNVFKMLHGKQLDLQLWIGLSGSDTGMRGRCIATSTCSTAVDRHPPCNIEDMLLTFAVAVRESQYGIGCQIKVQSVTTALRAVAPRYILDGHSNPCHASPAQHTLILPTARLIKKFKDNDPPPQPKLAIPVSTIRQIATKYKFSAHHEAVADLLVVAFFYLLWVGEYTTSSREHEKRTVLLRKCDMQLWKDGKLLDHGLELRALLTADSVTISIANTKNGTKGPWCITMQSAAPFGLLPHWHGGLPTYV